ncbi:Serine/threonine-protein kinase ppk13 [Verticillium dahliae VDG1]|nr:Serine/threonine-protein kinase ppk13 [Verticillium dahliae VDG1]
MIICRQASLLDGKLTTRQIHPSRKLEWHKCFDCAGQCEGRLDCARLDVPMDWTNTSHGRRVVLAITRLPAVNKTDYRGPVLMNPGDAQDPGTIDADRPLSLAPLVYARVKAYSSLYERQVQKTGLAQNSGTTYIARDMLEIVNKGDSASPDLKLWGFSDANAS